MNMKIACCLLLVAALTTPSTATDVAFKLKLVVDDGQAEKDLTENIGKVNDVNGDFSSSLLKLETHAGVVGIDDIQKCVEPAAEGVQPGTNVYKVNAVPEQDALDVYHTNRTGCTYGAIKSRRSVDLASSGELKFDGTNTYLMVFYVRALEHVQINTWWARYNHEDYLITINDGGYEAKIVEPNGVRTVLRKNAPGALAGDYYEKYYVALDSEYLTFGRDCDGEPILQQKISIRKGDSVSFRFSTNSYYGAKILYDCPLNEATIQHGFWGKVTKKVADWALKEVANKGKDFIEKKLKEVADKGIDAFKKKKAPEAQ